MRRGVVNKFNRGEVDPNALAREDVKSINNSAALMQNFVPLRLGPMQYRPGTEYLGALVGETYLVPFIRSVDDTYLLEFSNNLLRVWYSDALVARTAVTTAIVNGTFDGSISDWTTDDGSGSTSVWVAGGYLGLTGTGSTSAVTYQTVTSTETDAEHGIRIITLQGPVRFKLGTSGKNSCEILDTILYPGTHSFAFTPDSNFTITISNSEEYQSLVDSVVLEAAGTVTLPTSVAEAELKDIRYAQSAGVMYFAYGGAQFQVNRRGHKSWSVVDYRADDGPFGSINTDSLTMTPGALTGNTTLTSSVDYFTSDRVGQLFKLASDGQEVTETIGAENDGTNSIKVTGVGGVRAFSINITSTTSTITLQRSPDDSVWEDLTPTYGSATTTTYNDELDNSILYYRLWCKTGNYVDAATLTLTYTSGSIEGICRVTAYTSETLVDIQVLEDFGSTDATTDWYSGSWNGEDGYPTSVALYEGRLWWAGKTKVWGSVSDSYTSYDRTIEGASASIQKTVGFGPVDTVNWLAPSSRLIMGIASGEIAVRSSAFGEVLSPTNCNLKAGSNQGSLYRDAIASDDYVYFIQRSGTKVYQLAYALDADKHSAGDLNMHNQAICSAGIKRLAITHQPETRLWSVLDDGEMSVFTQEPTEDVSAWSRFVMENSAGSSYASVEDVAVLPGTAEDRVYLAVSQLTGVQSEGGAGGGGGGSDFDAGGSLGPDLITNGDFGTGDFTGWTIDDGVGGSISIVGGTASINSDQTAAYIRQDILTIGKDYYIEGDISSVDPTNRGKFQLGTAGGGGAGPYFTENGFHSHTAYNVDTDDAFCVVDNYSSGDCRFDNIVVREILSGGSGTYPGGDGGDPGGGGGGAAGTDGGDGGDGGEGLVAFSYDSEGTVDSYTSGTGNWTVPTGITSVRIMITGAGAGGGKDTGSVGGGSGAYVEVNLTVVPAETVAYVVGAGGAGATVAGNGADGGDSSITYDGNTYTAGGGSGDRTGGTTTIPAGATATERDGSTGGTAGATSGGGGGGAPGGSGLGDNGSNGFEDAGGAGGDGSGGDLGGGQGVNGADGSIVSSSEGRSLLKMARFNEALGGESSKHFDFFVNYTNPGSKAGVPTLTGLDHLDGETVGIWGDGQDRGTAVVSGGEITVSNEWVNVCVGVPYYADYTSSKLRYDTSSVLNKKKRVYNTGLIMTNYVPGSLTIGQNSSNLGAMPLIENGSSLSQTTTLTEYDEFPFEFDSETESDVRIMMRATGPVTVLAVTYEVDTKDTAAATLAALTK